MAEHTPTPWGIYISPVRETLCIVGQGSWVCGELQNGNGEEPGEGMANAEFIVTAANAHADMLAALLDARTQLEAYERERTGEAYNDPRINAAIAKAEGR